ncbi:MAG: hypothetical protein ABJE95_28505 [Byssovorax sp.]
MTTPRLLALPLLVAAASGCAVQLGNGWSSYNTNAVPRVVSFEVRAYKPRHDGPLFGLAVQAGVGESTQNPVRIRTGLLAGGYHFRTQKRFPVGLGFEPTFELGVGQPALRSIHGTGGYLGAGATLLYRVLGPGDDEPRFDTLTLLGDLALTARGGLWTAPEGPTPLYAPEVGLQLAFRITLSSDLTAPRTRENPGETPDLPGAPGEFR